MQSARNLPTRQRAVPSTPRQQTRLVTRQPAAVQKPAHHQKHRPADDPSRNRYSVLLDSGETYKFKPTAVRAERVEAAGGTRPKAKGKGKTGQGKSGK